MKKIYTILIVAFVLTTMLNTGFGQNLKLPKVKTQIKGNGIPATPKQIAYKQPNGSIIHLFLKGDGAIHWAVSTDGYTLLSNSNGYYEYAKTDGKGNLISSKIIAHDQNARSNDEIALLNNVQKGINYSNNQLSEKLSAFKVTKKGNAKSFPSTGVINNLVLMIQFSDVSFSNSITNVDNLLNQSNYGGIGSFKDYYYENSNGNLIVNTFVDGIYTAPYSHDYYGQNDGGGNDMYVEELFSSLIAGADSYIDFSQYDNDGDGIVDGVYMIYAGTGEASSGMPNDIWPHNNPGITPITVDGVTITSYTCSNEIDYNSGLLVGIGTICHEFGHALGLPDYYDTDYAGSGGETEGLGSWDIMSGGGYNGNEASPASHNSFSKAMMGWQLLGSIQSDGTYMLPPVETDTLAAIIGVSGSNEFFMFENRQWLSFDYELQHHGLLIYHTDYDYILSHWDSNDINVDPSHLGMDLEEADGETTTESGDTYPGSTSNTSFTDFTTPNSLPYYATYTGKPISSITESSNNIYFNISGFSNVNELLTKNSIKVYPTLANDHIDIVSNEVVKGISIINLQGQIIIDKKANDLQLRLNVSDIEEGTYFIKTKTSNQSTISKVTIVH